MRNGQIWGFANSDIAHLYPTNAEVEKHNHPVLKNLKNPIVQIDVKNSSANMRKLSTNWCGQLFNVIFLACEEKVTLKFNLCPEIGLANGSTGKAVDIKYQDDESPQNQNIPYCIWVDMDDYTGPPLFPHPERNNWYLSTHEQIRNYSRKGTTGWSSQVLWFHLDWLGLGPSTNTKAKLFGIRLFWH